MKADGWLYLVFLLAVSSRSSRTSPGVPMLVVARRPTGGSNWPSARFAALAEQGITGDVARAIVAHWSWETASGTAEWNYNVGNRKAGANEEAIDLGKAGFFKSYNTLAEGVTEYLALLRSSHYVQCWNALQSAPRDDTWVRCLGEKHYYEDAIDHYVSGYKTALSRLPLS